MKIRTQDKIATLNKDPSNFIEEREERKQEKAEK